MRAVRWLGAALIGVSAIGGSAPGVGAAGEPPRPEQPNAFEHVHALTFDAEGQTLWLGTHGGLFRSEDGRTWRPVALPSKQERHLDVMALVSDPKDPRTLYVGTHEAGVLKTTDGGASWSGINTGLGGADVHGVALDPNVPRKLHALVRGQGGGLYRTSDAGSRWVRVDDGPAGEVKVLTSVNISTGMGGIFLYAGTAEGLLKSPDCF